jgi:Flp pilus assembly protein CpaB
MKSRTVNLLVKPAAVAVAFAGITLTVGYGASRLFPPRRTAPPERERTSVWVAKRSLGMGTLIDDPTGFFEEKQLPETSEKAIRDLDELRLRRLNKPLTAGQVVTSHDLTPRRRSPYGDAMTLNVQSIVGADFVLPHSLVDVALETVGTDGEPHAETLLHDVLVLPAGHACQPGMQGYFATVQVTSEQAERVILAQRRGKIILIARLGANDKPLRP